MTQRRITIGILMGFLLANGLSCTFLQDRYVDPDEARRRLRVARSQAIPGSREAAEIDARLQAVDHVEEGIARREAEEAGRETLRRLSQSGASDEELGKAVRNTLQDAGGPEEATALKEGHDLREQHEAEKARAEDVQQLLAQEQKRTSELDSELTRVRQKADELEVRNRELAAQLQTVREQSAKPQEEAVRPAAQEQDEALRDTNMEGMSPIHHEVKRGETLFRLSRQYGVSVTAIKQWNRLKSNMIEVGQQLIVGYK